MEHPQPRTEQLIYYYRYLATIYETYTPKKIGRQVGKKHMYIIGIGTQIPNRYTNCAKFFF